MNEHLIFHIDSSESLRVSVRKIIEQAEKRQSVNDGTAIIETVLHHLVGAKLALRLGSAGPLHGASVADGVSDRAGDFEVGDVVIHVSSAPGEALMRKCAKNLEDGKRPLIITTHKRVVTAETLAEDAGLEERVELFDVEQFIAGNIYELGRFEGAGRAATARAIVTRYNELVEALETDPSLRIDIG